MAMTNSVESIYDSIEKSFIEKKQDLPAAMKYLNKIPVSYLMFVSCAALLTQLRILYPSLVNKYTHRIFSTLTNRKGDSVASSFINLLI